MQLNLFIRACIKPLVLSIGLIFFIMLILSNFRLVNNTTNSAPLGYYLLYRSPVSSQNSLKAICIHDSKYVKTMIAYGLEKSKAKTLEVCSNGYVAILKTIKAKSGDVIDINDNGVFINGTLQPNSKPLNLQSNIKPFYITNYKLQPGEYLALGNNDRSYDSRYFGLVTESEIKFSAILLERDHLGVK